MRPLDRVMAGDALRLDGDSGAGGKTRLETILRSESGHRQPWSNHSRCPTRQGVPACLVGRYAPEARQARSLGQECLPKEDLDRLTR